MGTHERQDHDRVFAEAKEPKSSSSKLSTLPVALAAVAGFGAAFVLGAPPPNTSPRKSCDEEAPVPVPAVAGRVEDAAGRAEANEVKSPKSSSTADDETEAEVDPDSVKAAKLKPGPPGPPTSATGRFLATGESGSSASGGGGSRLNNPPSLLPPPLGFDAEPEPDPAMQHIKQTRDKEPKKKRRKRKPGAPLILTTIDPFNE